MSYWNFHSSRFNQTKQTIYLNVDCISKSIFKSVVLIYMKIVLYLIIYLFIFILILIIYLFCLLFKIFHFCFLFRSVCLIKPHYSLNGFIKREYFNLIQIVSLKKQVWRSFLCRYFHQIKLFRYYVSVDWIRMQNHCSDQGVSQESVSHSQERFVLAIFLIFPSV